MAGAMAHQEAAPAEAQRHPALGGSWALVKRMHERGQMKAWTYTPLLGGFLFAASAVVLRRNMKAMLATQAFIGVGTISMANGVATLAIVKERLGAP